MAMKRGPKNLVKHSKPPKFDKGTSPKRVEQAKAVIRMRTGQGYRLSSAATQYTKALMRKAKTGSFR